MTEVERCPAGLLSCPSRRPECPILNHYLEDVTDCRAYGYRLEGSGPE